MRDWLKAAHVASHCKNSYLSAQYHRLAFRRGKKRAAVALAHTLLIIVYHLLTQQEEYQDLGGTYFDELEREKKEQRLVRQLEQLGFEVSLTPASVRALAALGAVLSLRRMFIRSSF